MKKIKLFGGLAVLTVCLMLTTSFEGTSRDKCVNGAIDADIYAPAWCVAGGLGCKICGQQIAQ